MNIAKFNSVRKGFLVLVFFVLSVSAQGRDYLIHTDANVSRLQEQIKNTPAVKEAWNDQLLKAEGLVARDHNGASDLQVLGLAYRMTGEKRFAESIKTILFDYIKRETWEGRELLQRTPPWRGGLGTAHTSFYMAIGYDCVYDELTSNERRQIAEGLVRVGIRPAMDDWINPESNLHTFDTMGHNWWSACVDMAGFAALAIRDEIPQAEQWAEEISELAIEWVNYSGSVLQNKPSTFDSDGGFYESINYAAFGVSQYLLFRYAFSNVLPSRKQPDLPILEKVTDFFINTTYYTHDAPFSVTFGDGNINKNGNSCALLLWNLGYHKQRYAWYLSKVNAGKDNEAIDLDTPNGLILNPDLPILPSNYTPDLALSHLYSDMGWATMRNSWENDATMVAVKSGFTWNHSHADAGSFIVFHNGKNLIIDSGNSSYGNPLYTKYYCQSEAHNVVLFNGEGQRKTDSYYGVVNPGSLHHLIDGDNFKYLFANATGPYAQILARNYRHFIWVGDVMLVIDDLLAYEPGQFEYLLHYNGESKRRGLDLFIKDGDAEMLVRPLFPATFPNGGLPHDFPEKMRLEERIGYEDHHPENKKAYWSISHPDVAMRTKYVSAITFVRDENSENLPVVETFEGEGFLGVRISQDKELTEIYFNLLADGRIKHR
nr:heparinase II/III family protein [Bacteroidales bacterium]